MLTLSLGCATWNVPAQTAKALAGPRQQRNEEVQRQFEENRQVAEFQSAAESFNRGDAKACEETLARLFKRNPSHRDARLLMVDVCLADNRIGEAFDHAKQALEAHPHDAQVQYAMALLLDVANQRSEALAYYQRAAKWEPNNEVYTVAYQTALQPNIADRNGTADTAVADTTNRLLGQGHEALRRGDPAGALRAYREAAATSPDDPQILLSAAAGALRLNRPDVAVDLLRPAEERFSQSAPLKRALGTAYYRLGDYRSAEVATQQALSLDKSSALAYFLMGCTLAKLGQSESAEVYLRQAQTIDPRYALR